MAYLEELLPEFRKGAKIRLKSWEPNIYIKQQGFVIVNNCNVVCSLSSDDIISDQWELYQKPIDWDYIIKNKCLCWFWDDDFNWAICRTLGKIEKGSEYGFIMFDDGGNRSPYKNCRPVRKDEVTFYEDKTNDC